jgi:signal transduction histidine kinase
LQQVLGRFITVNQLNYAEVTDSDGKVVLNLADSFMVGEQSDNPLVWIALTGSPFGHGILKHADQVYVAATLPILRDDRILGTLTLGRDFDSKFIQRLGNHPGINIAVWTNSSIEAIVPLDDDPLPPLKDLLSPEEIDEVFAGESLTKDLTIEGNRFQCSFSALTVMGSDHHIFYAAYRSMEFLEEAGALTAVHLAALFLLVTLVIAQFALWISRKVTRPLENLTRMSTRMAYLEFSDTIPVEGNDEISKLALSFNRLSKALQENIERKDRYASELAELNEDLERVVAKRTEELEHSNLKLKREITEKNDFLRAVSHDLAAPVKNIGGLVRLIEKKYADDLGEDGQAKLDRIKNNVKHELEMIDGLLDLSRLRTREGRKEVVDLMDLLSQIRSDLSYSLEECGILINVSDILPTIQGDKERVRQLFHSLIDNAIKYMGEQTVPQITIGWEENPKDYLFWVSDNGIGIAPENKDEIFGIFCRVRSSDTMSVTGRGVGLATAKTVTELYGGEMWVESQLGEGSTFYFTMSRALVDPKSEASEVMQTQAEKELAEIYAEDPAS